MKTVTANEIKELPPVQSIVRECLLLTEDPETVSDARVLTMVRARWAQLGGDPKKVHKHSVYFAKSKMRKLFGRPLTKERITAYQEQLQKDPSMKKKTTTIPQVVRRVLSSCTDPENEPTAILRKQVQDIWKSLGRDPKDIRSGRISLERGTLRKYLGSLTKEKIKQYREKLGEIPKSATVQLPIAKVPANSPIFEEEKQKVYKEVADTCDRTEPLFNTKKEEHPFVLLLKETRDFVALCGGFDPARRVLALLEELKK